jgi:hypothetical protein
VELVINISLSDQLPEVSKVLVVVEMVEDASLVLGVETVVVSGGDAVVESEDVLVESISVIELFDTVVEVRIAEKVVEVKPLVAAVGVSLEDVSGEFAIVEWMFVGVVPDTKLLVVEISVASVDTRDECAIELFDNAADVGDADQNIYIKFLSVTDISKTVLLETSAALVVFE